MNRRMILVLAIVLFAVVGCEKAEIGPTAWCELPQPDPQLHPMHRQLEGLLSEYTGKGLPGIILLVEDENGRWVGSDGFASLEDQVPMEVCHVSKIASITKLFVGALSMQLVDEGILSLDDPLSKWLDNDQLSKINNASSATFRHVLNHTSGIADVIEDNSFYLEVLNNPERFWTPDDLLPFVYGDPAEFPLGEDVGYSNTNLLLAAMMIEAATGRSHAELIRERIFTPLALNDTYYHWHDPLPDHTTQGYYDLYNNGTIINMTAFNTGSGNGYGGIYSTVFDVQVFIEALFKEQTLLSPEALDAMLTFTEEEEGRHRALGITVMKDFLERDVSEFGLGHRGRDLAYSADAYYFPNQSVTMVYLVNYGTDGETALQQTFFDFRDAVADLLLAQ